MVPQTHLKEILAGTGALPAGAIGTRTLANIILDTVREAFVGLDEDLNILFTSGSFDRSFQLVPGSAMGQRLFELDNGAWDIPALRALFQRTLPECPQVECLEVTRDFPRIGPRTLILHVCKAVHDFEPGGSFILGFEDITARRAVEDEKEHLQKHADDLLLQKEMLLAEMQHRVLNSLQIIASILMLKARAVTSAEAREHLQDAHRRVMSVAAVQQHLRSSGRADLVDIAPYLSKLCESLSKSMLGDERPGVLQAVADSGQMISANAVSLGLIVTELIINALKHAFPEPQASAAVIVRYEVNGTDWKLSVSDNGVGRHDANGVAARRGLGTSLVNALAHQLDAQVKEDSGPGGMTVSIEHATFSARPS